MAQVAVPVYIVTLHSVGQVPVFEVDLHNVKTNPEIQVQLHFRLLIWLA